MALAALHRLAVIHGDRDVGAASTMMLLAFPTAFFLLAPYPESLSLALVTSALLSAESDRRLLAGVLVGRRHDDEVRLRSILRRRPLRRGVAQAVDRSAPAGAHATPDRWDEAAAPT